MLRCMNQHCTYLFTTRNPANLVSCHLSVCPDDVISLSQTLVIQESLADAKAKVRVQQQCVYEGP